MAKKLKSVSKINQSLFITYEIGNSFVNKSNDPLIYLIIHQI